MKTKVLKVDETLNFLKSHGIPVAKFILVKKFEEALNFVSKVGFPVVLKVVSPQIIHKTDVGGIYLNIRSKPELQRAFSEVLTNVRKKVPKARIEGFLVQKMVENGQEIIIGSKKDEQFGHAIMFGLGGIFVEVFEDVSLRIVPISRKDAEEMIKEVKAYKILKGHRGKKYDVQALIKILLKTSRILEKNSRIKELDINPIIVLKKGAFAVDARIILED